MKLLKLNNRDLGIDLGTANILVSMNNKGIIFREPSVVAIKKDLGEIVAIGSEAKEMLGRSPDSISVVKPLKDGVIADLTATRMMLTAIITKIVRRYKILKPRVVIGVPSGITEVEKRAVQEVAISSGAREVYLIEEPLAAAIGAGIRVEEPSGNMIVDIGGGTAEIAVISLGGIVNSSSIKIAGDEMIEDIINYARKSLGIVIGEVTAEEAKIEIGCAMPIMTDLKKVIRGRDIRTGWPVRKEISSLEIMKATENSIYKIIEGIKQALEITPPELAADIIENGIMLTGGGALIKNLDKLISEVTRINVHVAENSLDCVAKGTMDVLENIDKLKDLVNITYGRV